MVDIAVVLLESIDFNRFALNAVVSPFSTTLPDLRSAMQRKGGKKRRQRDDEEQDRPRKRGKEEADEDDDIFGYGATDPAHGEEWTEEQDLRVSWLRFERRILVLLF